MELRTMRSLSGGGALWSACWDVYVDRSMRIAKRGTDLWIRLEGNVRLAALQIRGGTKANSSEIQDRWIRELEAPPERAVFGPSESRQEQERDVGGGDVDEKVGSVRAERWPWMDLDECLRDRATVEDAETQRGEGGGGLTKRRRRRKLEEGDVKR